MRAPFWFDEWVGLILQVANTPLAAQEDRLLQTRLQAALENIIDGGLGVAPGTPYLTHRRLPSIQMRLLRGRTVPVVDPPNLPPERKPRSVAPEWVIEGQGRRLRAIESELHAVVMALAADPRARRLRRCDWAECRAFFFARADHRRQHHFCSEDHRRAHDVAHRDPKAMAEYMRGWRAANAVLREARRRKKSTRRSRR
jgi:hypothetical protein